MAFVTICEAADLPAPGEMREVSVGGMVLCLANDGGRYAAVDNTCPHQGGPLAEGMLEAGKVLCPWHAWAFHLGTGEADHDGSARVGVYVLRMDGGSLKADV